MDWTVQLLHPVPVIQSENILSEGEKVHKTFRLLWVAIFAFSDTKVSFKSSLCVHLREGNQPANSPVVLSEALQKHPSQGASWPWMHHSCSQHPASQAARARTPQPRQTGAKSVWTPDLYNPITFNPFLMQSRMEHLQRCCAEKNHAKCSWKTPMCKDHQKWAQQAACTPSQSSVQQYIPGCGWGTLLVLWGRASLEWLSVVFGSLFLKTRGGEANNIPSELRKNLQWKLSHCLISIVLSSAPVVEKCMKSLLARSQMTLDDRGTRMIKPWMHRNKTMCQEAVPSIH